MLSYVLRTRLESLARIYKDRIESVGVIVNESHTTYGLEGERSGMSATRSWISYIMFRSSQARRKARTYQEWSQNYDTGTLSVTRAQYRIVNPAYVKDRSQATLRRKRFYHDLMHGLTNPRIQISK